MKNLKHPYLQIRWKEGCSYGGSQSWFGRKYLKKSACGVIGAADVILYLQGKNGVTQSEYMLFANMLCKKYLPVIPRFGMNGLSLMLGVNRYFKKEKLPYRSVWRISGKKLLSKIDEMLSADIPVILSVGPNFPKFWGKNKVCFYKKNADGNFLPCVHVKAHYVIVTGRDDLWLKISSWGKEYYIDFKEYEHYVKKHSSFLVSNILYVKSGNRSKQSIQQT